MPSADTKPLASYFSDYMEFHRTRGNQICHMIGIPLIVIGLFGLLGWVRLGGAWSANAELFRPDLGLALWLGATLWYLKLNWRIALPFSFITLGMYFLGRACSTPILWILFIVGWVFQGLGHAIYEKRSPAFLKNFLHVLVGPLWIYCKLFKISPDSH